ncbi:MAG: phosphopentomutase [Exilibacterium sp.]
MARAFVLVMDSLGIGATADADSFGDSGANTLAHIAARCAQGYADKPGLRSGPLRIPNLLRLGLGQAALACNGGPLPGIEATTPAAAYGYCAELSRGKDTPSGHWEIAGLPVAFEWIYFPDTQPCFPAPLIDTLIESAELPGILGNCHSSGTTILQRLGNEHIRTGKPIVYTSADSVLQIAAHEQHFGLERLLEVCTTARGLADGYFAALSAAETTAAMPSLSPSSQAIAHGSDSKKLGRVIARPFIGPVKTPSGPGFVRTGNRRDFTTPPHRSTLLDKLKQAGGRVIAIGKINDIFSGRGIGEVIKADGNMALFDATLKTARRAASGSLIMTNFVDFDTLYGHRRDVPGYAAALEQMDRRLPELEALLQPGDRVVITADHGCDPTWRGSDHTREHIPVLVFGPNVKPQALGRRRSFADIGQTLATCFGLDPLDYGKSFFHKLH